MIASSSLGGLQRNDVARSTGGDRLEVGDRGLLRSGDWKGVTSDIASRLAGCSEVIAVSSTFARACSGEEGDGSVIPLLQLSDLGRKPGHGSRRSPHWTAESPAKGHSCRETEMAPVNQGGCSRLSSQDDLSLVRSAWPVDVREIPPDILFRAGSHERTVTGVVQ